MHICYVDESGDTGTLPHAASPVQPVLVIAGVVVDHRNLAALTHDFIELKTRFSPKEAKALPQRFDILLRETKGTDVRRDAISERRRESRRALGFLDHLIRLMEDHRMKTFGRVWVKQLRYPVDAKAVFGSSMQAICACFQNYLCAANSMGMVIADHRSPGQNVPLAHSIFTQKFQYAGDSYDRLWEMPTFGHSNNHVGLQVADLLCSALLYPMAVDAYCTGHLTGLHVRPGYRVLRERFGSRLKALQHRFTDGRGKRCGGITVCDGLGQKSGAHLFADPSGTLAAAASAAAPQVPPVPPMISQSTSATN